jgi:signal transduction histidine kinase
MLNSLRFRLWLTYVLVILIAIAICSLAFFLYLVSNPLEVRQELQRLHLAAELISVRWQNAPGLIGSANPSPWQEFVVRADNTLSARVAVFNPDGKLLADSRADKNSPLPALSNLKRRLGQSNSFRDQNKKAWLFARQIMNDGNTLVMAMPRPRVPVINILRNEFFRPVLRGVAVALLLALLLSIWIARWVSAPLQRLAGAARGVAEGKYETIRLDGPGEVQIVGQAFNEMVERVQVNQQSQRDFLANVSHELKTPLTSIQGYAQAILDGAIDSDGGLQQAVGIIHSEAERMHHMVQDLLELARLDSGMVKFEMAPLDLPVFLEGLLRRWRPVASQAQVVLNSDLADLPPSSCNLNGDADRLAQVFNNLLDNAIKFTPQGGRVTLSARLVDRWVEITVADNGPGIPEDEMARIFERFYQTDKSRRSGEGHGVGLGLPIAQQIVEAHGGAISAKNLEPGGINNLVQGSVFVVKLPLA